MPGGAGRRLRAGVKAGLERLGFELRRVEQSPRRSLLGLADVPFATVLDVGANRGQFARLAAGRWPRASLVCFEPLPGPFAELQGWAARVPNDARCLQLALGAERAELEIFEHAAHSPSSSLLPTTERSRELYPQVEHQRPRKVQVARLDDLAAEGRLGPLTAPLLVKLDVQGYEAEVLRGAPQVMRRARACIAEVSVAPLYEGQASFDELYRPLRAAGLEFRGILAQDLAPDGSVAFMDVVFERGGGPA